MEPLIRRSACSLSRSPLRKNGPVIKLSSIAGSNTIAPFP